MLTWGKFSQKAKNLFANMLGRKREALKCVGLHA
jgi:hypothetical protein